MNRHLRNSRLGVSMMAVALASCMIEAADAGTVGAPRKAVQYRLKEQSLIGNQIHPAGAVVEYDGLPAENLEPLCDEGRARYAEYLKSNAARVSNLIAANQESGVGDPAKFVEQFTKMLAEQQAEHAAQMAKMLELQQQSATQLAEAAKNMAVLAAAISAQPATPAAPETPAAPPAPAADEKPTEKAVGKAKG